MKVSDTGKLARKFMSTVDQIVPQSQYLQPRHGRYADDAGRTTTAKPCDTIDFSGKRPNDDAINAFVNATTNSKSSMLIAAGSRMGDAQKALIKAFEGREVDGNLFVLPTTDHSNLGGSLLPDHCKVVAAFTNTTDPRHIFCS